MRLLVVVKKTTWELRVRGGAEPHLQGLLDAGASRALDLEQSHRAHRRTVDALAAWLDRRGVSWEGRFREQVTGPADVPAGTGLVVAVGGDGTVLHASHHLGDTPLLGVNSDPERSVGWLCGAGPSDMASVLEAVLDGRLRPRPLTRLAGSIDGVPLPAPAANDLLVAAPSPASTSRYGLVVPAGSETQRSSGLWIATAAGSTGAIRAAGGRRQPFGSRRIQFRVREPSRRPEASGVRLRGGFLAPGEALAVEWLGWEARVWIDGSDLAPPLRMGERLTVRGDGPRLWLVRPAAKLTPAAAAV